MPSELTQYLRVGQQALLHLGAGSPEQVRSSSTIRGWVVGASVLLDTPMDQGIPVSLERGESCTARCLVDGMAIGFNSVVADASRRQPIFRITWPNEIECVAIRKHERMKLHAPCVMHTPAGETLDAELRDLSMGGCRLYTTRSVDAGSKLSVSLYLFNGNALGPIPSVVRNEVTAGNGFLVGCQFSNLDAVARLEIDCYLSVRTDAIRAGKATTSRAVIIGRDPAFIESMRKLVGPSGCEVVSAPTVVDGFYALRSAPTQIVLAQYDLPDLNGADLCRAAHSALGLEKLPVILFGGAPEHETSARAAGAFRFFPAGTAPDTIARAIQEAAASARLP